MKTWIEDVAYGLAGALLFVCCGLYLLGRL